MSEIADVLLTAVEGDDLDAAASATLAAGRLRLDPGDLARLGAAVVSRLRGSDVSAEFVHAASVLPVAEVREAIRELLETDERGLDAAVALAEGGDALGLPVLLQAAEAGDHDVLRAIARVGGGDSPDEVWSIAQRSGSDDARFWLAIAVARSGRPAPWRFVVDGLVDGTINPEFAFGDPHYQAELARSIAPFPEVVLDTARAAMSDDMSRHKALEIVLAANELHDRVASGAAGGAPDLASGDTLDTPLSAGEARAGLSELIAGWEDLTEDDSERIGRVVTALPADEARTAVEQMLDLTSEIQTGNALVAGLFAGDRMSGRLIELDALTLLARYADALEHGRSDLGWQFAWTASRSGAENVIVELFNDPRTSPSDSAAIARFAAAVARFPSGDAPPFFGGGAVGEDVVPATFLTLDELRGDGAEEAAFEEAASEEAAFEEAAFEEAASDEGGVAPMSIDFSADTFNLSTDDYNLTDHVNLEVAAAIPRMEGEDDGGGALPDDGGADQSADDDDAMRWITDMPEDAGYMRKRRLPLDDTPLLRTRLAQGAVEARVGEVTKLTRADVAGRKVRFVVQGSNIAFRPVDGDVDAEALDAVSSEFLDPLGAVEAEFQVVLVPGRAGQGSVAVELAFDDESEYPTSQTIDFDITDPNAGVVSDQTGDRPEVLEQVLKGTPEPTELIEPNESWTELTYIVDNQRRSHAIRSPGKIKSHEMVELGKRIELLATGYHPAADPMQITDSDDRLLVFARLGAELHELVYGDALDAEDSQLARAEAIAMKGLVDDRLWRMKVVSESSVVPWALLYDAHRREEGSRSGHPRDLESGQQVDPTGFWGYRFRIDHQVGRGNARAEASGVPRLTATASPKVKPFINQEISSDPASNEQLAAGNSELLANLHALGVDQQTEGTDLTEWVLGGDSTDVLYIYCHGTGARSTDDLLMGVRTAAAEQATLELVRGEKITIEDLEHLNLPGDRRLAGQPLVFLNACKALGGDLEYANPFIELFHRRWWARAVVGGVASLPARFAIGFADRMLGSFFEGNQQLGACMHATVRQCLDEGNPYGLFYALYGKTALHVLEGPAS